MFFALEPKMVFANEYSAGIESVFTVTETGARLIPYPSPGCAQDNRSVYLLLSEDTSSITVTSGGARNRIGGPQVPVPLLT